MSRSLVVRPGFVLKVLCGAAGFFMLAHLVGHGCKQFGHERVFGLVRLFDMDREANIPTLYSSMLFMLGAGLFGCVWYAGRGEVRRNWLWLLFGAALIFLGLDEACQFHEYLTEPISDRFEMRGFFLAAWVIPYGGAALLGLFVCLPFIWKQRKDIRWLLLASGGVFLAGALVVEMVTSKYVEVTWRKAGEFNKYTDFGYGNLVAVEETLEMLGLSLLAYTLLRLLQHGHGGLKVVVPPPGIEPGRP